MQDKPSLSLPVKHQRRWQVRLFVAFMVGVLVYESIPLGPNHRLPHRYLTILLGRVGLWQRPWNMFSPDPCEMTSWVSAEIFDKDNQRTVWSSPQWDSLGPVEKFYRFRHLNYYNCFQRPQSSQSIDDLADYLRRTVASTAMAPTSTAEIREVKLFLNVTKPLLPQDGTLPSRDETYLMFSSQPLSSRSYSP